MSNIVIKKIPLVILQNAQQKLDEVMDMLGPCLVTLSQPERQALVKIGEESFNFIAKSYELAIEYPELFPSFVKAGIFGEDFSTVQALKSLTARLNKLKDGISDTEMVTGNHALEAALAFYQTLKIAARRDIPGTRVIYEEIKPRRCFGRPKKREIKKDDGQLELFGS